MINGETWKWRIGRQWITARNETTGKGIRDTIASVMYMWGDDVERAQWKRTLHVKPRDIAMWIKINGYN